MVQRVIFKKIMKNHFCIQKPYLHTKIHIDCPKIDYFIDKKALVTKFFIQTVDQYVYNFGDNLWSVSIAIIANYRRTPNNSKIA